MKRFNIAILGATSHIAKGLISNFLEDGNFALHLYARTPLKIQSFVDSIGRSGYINCTIYEDHADFSRGDYDVVINCVGVGTANKLQGDYSKYFTVIGEYDDLVLDYLRNGHPDVLYISMSSGAVYGGGFSEYVSEDTANCIRVNHVDPKDYYGIVRLYTEAKHRAFTGLNIVDLRIFSYFSRFIDLTDDYFITDVLNSILHKTPLVTADTDFVRDFVHPNDLFALVLKCIKTGAINAAFDVTSTKPVKKREILEYFSQTYGLRYEEEAAAGGGSATGVKNNYYSTYHTAERIGHTPKYSSLDAIQEEAAHMLKGQGRNDDNLTL